MSVIPREGFLLGFPVRAGEYVAVVEKDVPDEGGVHTNCPKIINIIPELKKVLLCHVTGIEA